MSTSIKEELKSHEDKNLCCICGKRILKSFANDKGYRKVEDHRQFTNKYRGPAHSICNLKFNVCNEIPVVVHNGSNYDNHFIIKELGNNLRKNSNALGKIQKNTKLSPFLQKKK